MKRVALLFAMAIALSSCGGGSTTRTVTVTTSPARQRTHVRVYFLYHGKVQPVARSVPAVEPAWLGAWQDLAVGPTGETPPGRGISTAMFDFKGRWTLGLTNDNLLSLDTVELPRAFVAQTVYTLSQFAPALPVVVNGRRYRRADFEDLTPAILVESPLSDQQVGTPLQMTGTANTFEATFEYELLDSGGKVLAKHFVTATSGSGTRGTFDVTIPYPSGHGGPGKLVVYESSAKDGSRINVVPISLRLAD